MKKSHVCFSEALSGLRSQIESAIYWYVDTQMAPGGYVFDCSLVLDEYGTMLGGFSYHNKKFKLYQGELYALPEERLGLGYELKSYTLDKLSIDDLIWFLRQIEDGKFNIA